MIEKEIESGRTWINHRDRFFYMPYESLMTCVGSEQVSVGMDDEMHLNVKLVLWRFEHCRLCIIGQRNRLKQS
jgi:hypothetical protein